METKTKDEQQIKLERCGEDLHIIAQEGTFRIPIETLQEDVLKEAGKVFRLVNSKDGSYGEKVE